jgi:hypothetical protein
MVAVFLNRVGKKQEDNQRGQSQSCPIQKRQFHLEKGLVLNEITTPVLTIRYCTQKYFHTEFSVDRKSPYENRETVNCQIFTAVV